MKKTATTILCAAVACAAFAGCTTNLTTGGSNNAEPESKPAVSDDSRIEVPTEVVDSSVSEPAADPAADSEGSSQTKGYPDEQLLAWAAKYYSFASGSEAPSIEIDHKDGDMVYIHIFEDVKGTDDSDPGHRTTLEWYIVDKKTGAGKNFAGEEIDLTTMYKRGTSIEESIEDSKRWEAEQE